VSQQELLKEVRKCEKNVHKIWIKPNLSSKRFIFEIKNIIKITLCMKLCSRHLFNLSLFQVEQETGTVLTFLSTTQIVFYTCWKSNNYY